MLYPHLDHPAHLPNFDRVFSKKNFRSLQQNSRRPKWLLPTILYLPFVVRQTGLSKQCRPRWNCTMRNIRAYTVCHHPAIFRHNCTCSNFKTSMVRSWGVGILRVNTVLYTMQQKRISGARKIFESHFDLRSLLNEKSSIVSGDSLSRQRRSWSDCTEAHADLSLHCFYKPFLVLGFTAQSTRWGHVQRIQFT